MKSLMKSKERKIGFRFANDVPLNASEFTQNVNVLDYVHTDEEGKRHTWCWITDIELTEETVEDVMKGGRCRWHIEKPNV